MNGNKAQRARRLICALLILIVLITGCNNAGNNPAVESGSLFEEKEISIQTDFELLSIRKANDKFVCSYRDPQDHSYHLAYTDSKFTKISPILNDAGNLIPAAELLDIENPYGKFNIGARLVYDLDDNGNIYILQYETVKKDDLPYPYGKKMIFAYNKDGVLTRKISIENSDRIPDMQPGEIIAQDNRFIIVAGTGIQMVDLEGKTIGEIAVPSNKAVDVVNKQEQTVSIGRIIDAALINKNEMVILQDQMDRIDLIAYNLSNQKNVWTKTFREHFLPVKIQFEKEQDRIFVASNDKVISFGADGAETGEVIDFNQYAAGIDNSTIMNGDKALAPGYFVFEQPDFMNVYMVTSPIDPQINKIYSYRTLTGNEKAERMAAIEKEQAKKTNVTLFVPFIEYGLEQKIAQYERLNPHIKINLISYRKDAEEFNPAEYSKYADSQLLSNKTRWDIMAVQLLPYEDYIKKGYLADIDQIASEQWIKGKERFFPNIIDSVRVDGKLMIVPARIAMHVNLADKKTARDLPPLQYKWSDLIRLSSDAKKSNSGIKSWSFFGSNGYQFPFTYEEIMDSFQTDLLSAQGSPEGQKQLLTQFLDTMKAIGIKGDHAQPPGDNPLFHLTPFIPSHFPNYIELIGNEKMLLPSPASPKSGKHSFTLQEGYSINEDSKVKEEALKFMLFLIESVDPNNLIFKKSFDNLKEQLGTSDQRRNAIEQLRTIVASLNALRDLDNRITDAVLSRTEQYVNGITDKETAVRTIQDKLREIERAYPGN
ncbi:extracellular solute-binding protein [Cohnella faecalis]|uniref:Extracellular solute-binding protein n=1 Tax=Cohnella faecalis TaxID=2315694 RepID=A0A398CJU7_9BACL|nr:extracellular solute-binding protein [Cohnella faecalis]RIE02973.1 extracellular solute-binding protein [Cohnella faecalis]